MQRQGQPGPHPARSVHPPGDVIYQQGSSCPSVITPCHRPVGPGGLSHPQGWGLPQDCPPLQKETGGLEAPVYCWPLLLNLAMVCVSLQFLPLVAYFPQSILAACLCHNLSLPLVCLWPHCVACRILVPRPGMEPGDLDSESANPNHWATRDFPLPPFDSLCVPVFLHLFLSMYCSVSCMCMYL